MLRLSDIFVSYGMIAALKGVSLEVREGEIVALIGANGAGKSTTLMSISGITGLMAGTIAFKGRAITGLPSHEIVGLGICQVPEGRHIFPRMTVRENLEMGAFLEDTRRLDEDMARVFAMFPVLEERNKQLGGTLSGGEQQMLAIGRALMSRPKLLLLDEPSLGLAPIIVSRIFKIIEEINRQGATILLVEQNAKAALRLASRAYVMESGRIVMQGPASGLANDPGIKKAYLGE
ncbi:MAG: ABC transporter ATP-binding protein [Nitrospirae bacterium]|nr:ABC transporter ATP-binding protein [Nitrospirota bacterium]NTW66822.1 ABC transporter ATP-binding protein [Nitrospirota bacterium]